MRKLQLKRPLVLVFAGLMPAGGLAGCDAGEIINQVKDAFSGQNDKQGENEKNEDENKNNEEKLFNIKFINYDDSLLLETTAKSGTMPQYTGKAPKRPGDAQYTYRFSGWDPTLAPATSDQTYKATFTTSINTYTVTIGDNIPFNKEYGSKLDEPTPLESYILGEDFYAFDGWEVNNSGKLWNFSNDVVTENVVLTAHFVKTTALNVTFFDYDDTVLDTHKTGSGLAPQYKGDKIPSKPSTISETYEFDHWDPSIETPITEDTEYRPVFMTKTRQYNINFLNFDGSLIETIPTDYGTMPAYNGQTPVKPNDNVYKYTFIGWTPEFELVTCDASYTAVYQKSPLDPATVVINQYIDDNANPVFTDSFEVANHTTYTVDSKYHKICANDYNPNNYSLKSSEIVDLYLIAGQSNAAGYSQTSLLLNKNKDDYPATPNVTFYGEIDERMVTDITTPVTFGLGPSVNHFGPEVGMAKMISEANPNGISTIVKTAYGGSWLYDYRSDSVSQKYGNWCSPSMRDASADPNITGKCYDHFINNINKAVKYYKDSGCMVRLSGMLWVQGEQESSQANSAEYGTHLEALINDLRTDFSTIFDYNATTAPFVIGKISSTFAGGHLGVDNVRKCEEDVAKKMDDVYALETYEIVDPATGNQKPGCPDKYHFAADDMLSIGERTAELMGEKIVPEGTASAVNILRKQVNGTTTFDLYFETRTGGSYNIEYYFEDNAGVYQKSAYKKLVSSTPENTFYTGDKVTVESTEIPADITDKPSLKTDCAWSLNNELSLLTGFVLSDGKLTLKIYYEQKDPHDNNYSLTFNQEYWESRKLSGKAGTFTQTSSHGQEIEFTSNEWIEYTPDGWGSFVTNGAHWDAFIKNTTPIKGIKKIEFQIWWNMFNYDTQGKVPYINVITSKDNLYLDSVKTKVEMGTGTQATLGERFTLDVEDYPSYLTINFGDDSGNTFFDSIMNLKITYCDFGTPVYYNYSHNVNYDSTTKTARASSLDGTGWSNFDGSYMYFGTYSKTAIFSANISHIDHDFRAYSGICLSTGKKVDESKDDTEPRNYRSLQVGLAHNGIYSSKDHRGEKGADASNYYTKLGTALGTTGKLTVVLRNDIVFYYINDVFNCSKSLTEAYSGGFAAGESYMFGVWFANYFNSSRSVQIIDEIYDATEVENEIATNPVYSNLR